MLVAHWFALKRQISPPPPPRWNPHRCGRPFGSSSSLPWMFGIGIGWSMAIDNKMKSISFVTGLMNAKARKSKFSTKKYNIYPPPPTLIITLQMRRTCAGMT